VVGSFFKSLSGKSRVLRHSLAEKEMNKGNDCGEKIREKERERKKKREVLFIERFILL